jgi:DNA processing protein
MVDTVGSRRYFLLLEKFDSPKAVWEASVEELLSVRGLNKQVVSNIDRSRKGFDLQAELKVAREHDVAIIPYTDARYPELLRTIYDPPPVIYVKGNTDILQGVCIGVVGSRKATAYGEMVTRKLVTGLAQQGIVIVSGLARGIDSFAHKAALAANGFTIAILGCGMDVCYPPENKRLFEDICSRGAVITTYPFGTRPQKQTFPARNRLISGISLGTLVVEAGERSGALITADFALEQGREVFAVPGSILSLNSLGTNRLIKQGARVAVDASDIIEELGLKGPLTQRNECNSASEDITMELSLSERLVLNAVCLEPKHINRIVRETGLSTEQVSSSLIRLELAGQVKGLQGQMFARVY